MKEENPIHNEIKVLRWIRNHLITFGCLCIQPVNSIMYGRTGDISFLIVMIVSLIVCYVADEIRLRKKRKA